MTFKKHIYTQKLKVEQSKQFFTQNKISIMFIQNSLKNTCCFI